MESRHILSRVSCIHKVDEAGNNTRETGVDEDKYQAHKKKKEKIIVGTFPNCYQFPGFSPRVSSSMCCVVLDAMRRDVMNPKKVKPQAQRSDSGLQVIDSICTSRYALRCAFLNGC
jgi:hypothetical protein